MKLYTQGFFYGYYDGITGLVREPIEGAKKGVTIISFKEDNTADGMLSRAFSGRSKELVVAVSNFTPSLLKLTCC